MVIVSWYIEGIRPIWAGSVVIFSEYIRNIDPIWIGLEIIFSRYIGDIKPMWIGSRMIMNEIDGKMLDRFYMGAFLLYTPTLNMTGKPIIFM